MSLYDFHDRGVCCAQVVIDVGHPDLIQMFFEGDTDLVCKETAEVLVAQAEMGRDLIK